MKTYRAWITWGALAIIAILGLLIFQEVSFSNPFQQNYELDFPVFATGDQEGNHYVIDSAFRRVNKISPENEIVYQIIGGLREEDRFFYTQQIEVTNEGYLFLLDENRDEKGFYLQSERILLYSPNGEFLRSIYENTYPEGHNDLTLVQRNRIVGMNAISERSLQFYILQHDGIVSKGLEFEIQDSSNIIPRLNFNLNTKSSEETIITNEFEEFFPFPNALLFVVDIAQTNQGPVVTLRDGTIRLLNTTDNSNAQVLFSGQINEENTSRTVPWELASTTDGQVYFVDLEQRAIKSLDGSPLLNRDIIAEKTGMDDLYEYDYYRLDISSDNTIYTTNDSSIILRNSNGSISSINSATFSFAKTRDSVIWWFSAFVLAITIFAYIWLIYDRVMHRVVHTVLIQATAVVILVVIIGAISSFLLIQNFNDRYINVILQRLSQTIQILPLLIDGDSVENLTLQSDFGGSEYTMLRNNLLEAFDQNKGDWNRGHYFALYRIIDERLYGFMYLNGQIGMYYPFDWLGGEEDPSIYDLAYQGEINTEMIRDISGEWIYGVGPIFNSEGDIVGIFETGTDLYTLTLENQQLVRDLIWELVTVWIIIMLLVIEISVLMNLLRERSSSPLPMSSSDLAFSDGNLARPLIFLYFTSISFSIAFLPLLSRELFQPLAEGVTRGGEIAIALPLSLETALFGLATIFTSFLTKRHGWKNIFTTSLIIVSIGLTLSALSRSFQLFLVARSFTGLGSGMGYIALRSFINLEGRIKIRNKAYSNFYSGMIAGVNVGLVLGASVSALIGYSNVFFIALGLMFITAILFFTLYRDTKFFWKSEQESTLTHFKAITTLIKTPRLWAYFIFLLLPTYIAASYVIFHFPLFAESTLQLSTPQVGRALIMNGLFIVYLGPVISHYLERKIGAKWGSILGSLFWGIAIILAGITANVFWSIVILAFMGLTEGFAVSSQNSLFFSEKNTSLVGQDRATGYFELFGKIGDTLGPIIFAFTILLLGRNIGLIILGIVVSTMTIPYLLSVQRSKN